MICSDLTNHLKTQWLRKTNFYYHSWFCRSTASAGFFLEVFHMGVVIGWPGLEPSESSPGLAVQDGFFTLHFGAGAGAAQGWLASLSPCSLSTWLAWASSLPGGLRIQRCLCWWLPSSRVSFLRGRKWNWLDLGLTADQSSHASPCPLPY